MSDYKLPDLPSDEDLGIAGMEDEDHPDAPPPRPPPEPGPGSAAARPPAPRSAWWGGITAAVLLVATWGTSANRTLPPAVPANAPDTAFSSGRAMAQLVDLARAPRPVGSPEHARVRELLVSRLAALGFEPEIHTSLSLRRSGPAVAATTLRNVLVRVPGTASTGAVLLTAHYDSQPLSHGAGDDGVGVVAILETLRALGPDPGLRNDLIALLTDGEEAGLLGARAFVDEHPWMEDVAVVLSAEMRGGGGPAIVFETGADNGWIVQALQAGDPRPLAHSLGVDVYRRLQQDTDFTPFREAGIQGLNSAAIGRAWIYHQPTDVPANIEEATIQHHGERLLGMARELGGRDLGAVTAPDRIHFVVPFLGLVSYEESWALPLAGGAFLLWVGALLLVVLRGRSRGGGPLAPLLGLGLAVLSIAGTATVGWGLLRWLPRFHPEFGALTPAFYEEGWYVAALLATGSALTLALLSLARRRLPLDGLTVGALLVPVAAGLWAALAVPSATPVVVWPTLASLLAATVLLVLRLRSRSPADEPGLLGRGLALVLALPVLALMVPVVELLWVTMGFHLAMGLGALAALTLVLLLPALDGLRWPNGWWAPLAGLAAGVIFVTVGIARAGPGPERPLPSTLLYTLDRDEGQALWLTRADAGMAWVRERLGPMELQASMDRFGWPDVTYLARFAPVVDVALPEAEVVEGPDQERGGRLRLRVDSRLGAEIVRLELPDEAEAAFVEVGGRPFPPAPRGAGAAPGAARPVTHLTHQGAADPGLVLTVELDPNRDPGFDVLPLVVVEEILRPGVVTGRSPFERPPYLMPSVRSRSDRALLRTVLAVPLGEVPAEEPSEDPETPERPGDAEVPEGDSDARPAEEPEGPAAERPPGAVPQSRDGERSR